MRILRKKRVRKWLTYSLVGLMIVFTLSCFREYYKVRRSDVPEFQDQFDARFQAKYFIIHQNDYAYHFDNLIVGEETITGDVLPLAWNHNFYQLTQTDKTNRYRGAKEKQVLDEVHLWLKPEPTLLPVEEAEKVLTVPNDMIDEIHVYEMDRTTTAASHAIGVMGIVGTITAVVMIINVGTKVAQPPPPKESSCPFVYQYDGEEFRLVGESFPGALLPNLERDDYLPLPDIQAVDGQYRIRLANELMENQYIDLAELLVVNHPADETVLLDQEGQPHSITHQKNPLWARSSTGSDLAPALAARDSIPFLFNDRNDPTSAVTLAFAKPTGTDAAKLVLRAKNSYWLDLLWYDFTKRYGAWYDSWVAEQGAAPAEEVTSWMESQHLPLRVSVKTDEGWEKVTDLPMVGPVAARDLVVPVDLRKHTGAEVRIRLETGFLFWELDYAAMDFSENRPLALQSLAVSEMLTQGADQAAKVRNDDGDYLHLEPLKGSATLHFPAIQIRAGEKQSVFLKSNGYYLPVRDFTGLPEVLTLWKYNREGHFSDYSQQQFDRLLEKMDVKIERAASSGL